MFPKREYGEHSMQWACIRTTCGERYIFNMAIWRRGQNFAAGLMAIAGASLQPVN